MNMQFLPSAPAETAVNQDYVADDLQRVHLTEQVRRTAEPRALLRLHLNEAATDMYDEVARYPDLAPLVAALAKIHGVAHDNILVTAGADSALEAACRAASGSVVVLDPDFPRYHHHAENANLTIQSVALTGPPALFPAERFLTAVTAETGAIMLSTVGNPTGYRLPDDGFVPALYTRASTALLIIDEVYSLFVGVDYSGLATQTPGVVSIRSLSKVGFAGLRVGYAVGHPTTLARLARFVSPYIVAGPSIGTAVQAVGDHHTWQTAIGRQKAACTWLCEQLAAREIPCFPSPANWALVRLGPAARAIGAALADWGILVQHPQHPALADVLRISTPNLPAVAQLVRTLDKLLDWHGQAASRAYSPQYGFSE